MKMNINIPKSINQILIINIVIFSLLWICETILSPTSYVAVVKIFANPTDLNILYKPWTLITSAFTHVNFLHLFFNMISLYFIGEYFKMAFNNRQIWLLYILGHIFGVVLSICVNVLVFDGHNLALGASCGVSTLVAGLCLTYPNLPVYIYFIKSNLKWLLILFAANSVFMLFTPNMIGGMGHLFSMVFGLIYVKFLYKFVK